MANYATLKAAIQQVIKTNGNNEITGALLQQSLLAMIDSLGAGYQYVGIATPATNPGTPDQNVFYFASTAGTYANFGGLVLADGEVAILKYNGAWSKDSTGAASLEKVTAIEDNVADILSEIAEIITDLSSKADKDTYAIEGNLAEFDENGNPIDSGIPSTKIGEIEGKVTELGNSAGIAEGIADSISAGTAQEIVFRKSGGDGVNYIKRFKGKTLMWNQKIKNPAFVGTTDWSTSGASISAADNVLTWTASDSTVSNNLRQSIGVINNHKYFVRFDIKGTQANTVSSACGTVAGGGALRNESYDTNWKTISQIVVPTSSSDSSFYIRPNSDGIQDCVAYIRNVRIHDLTLMFGSGSEPATVEEFEAMFPLPYYADNAGTPISNDASALENDGFNQWDEEKEEGLYSAITGAKEAGSQFYRSTNYIPVFPNTDYYYKSATSNTRVLFYDANKNLIGSDNTYYNRIFTTPNSCYYLTFFYLKEDGEICINLSDPAKNGTYEPYWKRRIEINLSTLKDKEGNLVFPYGGMNGVGTAFDSLEPDADGVIRVGTRAFGRVDLGDLSWIKSDIVFYAPLTSAKYPSSLNGEINAICARYGKAIPYSAGSNVDKVLYSTWVGASTGTQIRINDSQYGDVASFKAAISGVMLYYELATPVVSELAEPIPNAILVDELGTEHVIFPEHEDGTPSAPLCTDSNYSISVKNLVSKLASI